MTAPFIFSDYQIHLSGVSKRFGERQVLDDINLTIPQGQFVAIVGRSGCGKSTLLRLVAGLEEASDGYIGLHFKEPGDERSQVRMMFQDSRLLPWKSVLDNVLLGTRGFNLARYALEEVGLWDRRDEWPSRLSGGQKQRVALARALVHRPQLLLLDEPLGALDALTRLEMQQLIERLWQEHRFTVLLVTHDVSEAVALADRILVVEDGKIGLDLAVNLPRPRLRTSLAVAELEDLVLRRIMEDRHPYVPEQPQEATTPLPIYRIAV